LFDLLTEELLGAGRAMELEEAAGERGVAAAGGSTGGDPDRLSALLDSLLHAIMSLLKAWQAVQTCMLSTRWRHLWRSVSCLDVDHDEFRTAATATALAVTTRVGRILRISPRT
jgi:hypothetical protein